MFLFLGCWSLVLFDLSIYIQKHTTVMFCFALLSRILEFSDENKSFATASRLTKTILQFFQKYFALIYAKNEQASPFRASLCCTKFFLPLTFQPRSSSFLNFNTTVELIKTKPNFYLDSSRLISWVWKKRYITLCLTLEFHVSN